MFGFECWDPVFFVSLDHHVRYSQMRGCRVVHLSNLNQKPQSP